jgi:hypothetical protein
MLPRQNRGQGIEPLSECQTKADEGDIRAVDLNPVDSIVSQ